MTTEGVKRKLTAILSADVKGYSRLMGEDEEATVRTLSAYREVMSSLIQQYRGRVVDSPGDNLLAEFASVVDAVQCAVEMQQVLRARNALLPANRRMEFRIGINLGDVIQEGERIYGDGVNVAARVEGLAEAGGICISGSAWEQIENKLPLRYEYLGEHSVKNITKPVRVYRAQIEPEAEPVSREKRPRLKRWQWAVVAVGALLLISAGAMAVWNFYLRPSRSSVEPASVERMAFPLPDKPSIAVLPFTNMSGDSEQEYFSDGITEDLITDLAKISGLFVIGRNSTFVYKGKTVKTRQVAEELGVRYVLEGSVRKADNRVRINAQLIDATTGGHLWAERYDGKMDEVFALQDQINQKIVTALAVKLTGGEKQQVILKETDNIAAYDAFLKGWGHYLRRTPEDFGKACSYFEKAIELDPNYGRAYAALARTYYSSTQNWPYGHRRSHKALRVSWWEAHVRAREYLKTAMKRPTSIAHALASEIDLFRRLHKRAIAEAQQAIALAPNDSDSHATMANALIFAGRPEEALDSTEEAMRLDPHNIAYPLYLRGLAQFSMGQLEEAVTSLERALTHNPEFRTGSGVLAAAYSQLGREEEARAALINYKKSLMDWAAILYHAMWFWPFKDREVAERFADGLLKAGLPGQPSGYYKIYEERNLTGEEIKELVFGRTMRGINPWRGEFRIDRTTDGKMSYRNLSGKPMDYDDEGTSWIEGDMLCNQWQVRVYGVKHCMIVFPNPEGTPEMKNEYFWISDYCGIQSFSVVN